MKISGFFSAILFLMFLLPGCGETKPDNVELTILLSFPDGVNCTTYLADHFTVTLYDSKQKKKATKTIDCTEDAKELTLYVEKDTYYITAVLKGADNLNKSYGSGTVDLSSGDSEIKIKMEEYLGGVTFKWKSDDCKNYGIHNLKFSLETEDGYVSSVIWGKQEKIEDFEILCSAEILEIVNIPAVLYTANAKGFRTEDSEIARIVYTVPNQFKLVSGQDVTIDINEYKSVQVSDIKIKWAFDSKSVAGCESAGVEKVIASLISTVETLNKEIVCDDNFENFYFYDILPGKYEILLRAMSSSDKTLFEGSIERTIEKNHIGSDILSEEIFLKEN